MDYFHLRLSVVADLRNQVNNRLGPDGDGRWMRSIAYMYRLRLRPVHLESKPVFLFPECQKSVFQIVEGVAEESRVVSIVSIREKVITELDSQDVVANCHHQVVSDAVEEGWQGSAALADSGIDREPGGLLAFDANTNLSIVMELGEELEQLGWNAQKL